MIKAEHKTSNPQNTPHCSPSWVSYGVSIVSIWENTDHILMAPHCFVLGFTRRHWRWIRGHKWDGQSYVTILCTRYAHVKDTQWYHLQICNRGKWGICWSFIYSFIYLLLLNWKCYLIENIIYVLNIYLNAFYKLGKIIFLALARTG